MFVLDLQRTAMGTRSAHHILPAQQVSALFVYVVEVADFVAARMDHCAVSQLHNAPSAKRCVYFMPPHTREVVIITWFYG